MRKISSTIVAAAWLVAGCTAFQPTRLDSLPSDAAPIDIGAGKISIVDLAKPGESEHHMHMGAGFRRIGDVQFATPPSNVLKTDLEQLLAVSGSGPSSISG